MAGARGEAGGTVASRCRLQAGSLCSCVSRSRSRGSGWRPLQRSSLKPWPQRTTLVRQCYYIPDIILHSFPCLSDSMNTKSICEYALFLWYTVDEANLGRGKWLERIYLLDVITILFGTYKTERLTSKGRPEPVSGPLRHCWQMISSHFAQTTVSVIIIYHLGEAEYHELIVVMLHKTFFLQPNIVFIERTRLVCMYNLPYLW